MAGHAATVEVGQLFELGGAHRALDVGVEGSCCFEGDDFLFAGDVPPVEDYQEDEHRDDQSNDELEEVIDERLLREYSQHFMRMLLWKCVPVPKY